MERILFITNDFPPQSGGIQSFIEGLMWTLPKDSVVVHTSTFGDSTAQDLFDQKLFDELGAIVVRDRQRILLPTPALFTRIAGTIHAHRINTVVFGASVPLGLLAPKLRSVGITKMIAITHGHEVWWSKVPIFSTLLRRVARHVDHLTYLGSFTKAAISQAIDSSDLGKLVHLPPGVDVERFKPGAKPSELLARFELSNKVIIMCVGRLVQRKGQDVLIRALAKIRDKHPNAHLVIAGSGNYESKLRSLTSELGLQASVTFAGRIPNEELSELFRAADIFASPTRERFGGLEVEGLGIVFLEASATGVPVIAGKSGGSPDAVLENKTGLVVDGRNIESLAVTLDALLSDPTLRETLGAAGRDWMETQWSWKVIGERFRSLLDLH